MTLEKPTYKARIVAERHPLYDLNFLGDELDSAIMGAACREGEVPRVLYSLSACKFLSSQSQEGYMEKLRAIEGFLTVRVNPAPLFLIQPPAKVFREVVKEHDLITWDMLSEAVVGIALEGVDPVALVYNPAKAVECLSASQDDSDGADAGKSARHILDTQIMSAQLGSKTPFFLDYTGLQ